jgi:hypothetical protein
MRETIAFKDLFSHVRKTCIGSLSLCHKTGFPRLEELKARMGKQFIH